MGFIICGKPVGGIRLHQEHFKVLLQGLTACRKGTQTEKEEHRNQWFCLKQQNITVF